MHNYRRNISFGGGRQTRSMISILLYLLIGLAEGKTFSLFSRTTIFHDICSDINGRSFKTRSVVGCGRRCTEDMGCRRFLFCSKDWSCVLYSDGTNCVMSEDSTTCSCYRKRFGRRDLNFTCPLGYYGDECMYVVKDCSEAQSRGLGMNLPDYRGQTYIKPLAKQQSFEQFCMYIGIGIMPILKRNRVCIKLALNRSIAEYEEGFGTSYRNQWVGLNKIVAVMKGNPFVSYTLQIVQIVLTNSKNQKCNTYYRDFVLGNKTTQYRFTARYKASSECGDSMLGGLSLLGRPFSTFDFDHTGANNCPARLGGGWWFHASANCTRSFLTGTFDSPGTPNFWKDDLDGETFNAVSMILYGK